MKTGRGVEKLVEVYVEVLFERDKLIRMRANLAADEYDKHVTPKILELEAHIASRKAALIAHVNGLRDEIKTFDEERVVVTELLNGLRAENERLKMDSTCLCDSPTDEVCRLHERENQLQDERQKLEQENAELRAMLTKVLEVTEEVDDISNCVACGNGIGGDGTGHAEDCLIQRAKQHVTKGTQPRALWIIQDRGESYVDFSLYYECVVGDPMTYRVPREHLTYLSISEIPEKAHKEGWAMWLG